MKGEKMKKLFKSYGIALVIVAIYAFVKLPVLRLDFTSGFTTLILFFVLAGILDMMLDRGENTSKMAKNNFLIAALLLIVIIIIQTCYRLLLQNLQLFKWIIYLLNSSILIICKKLSCNTVNSSHQCSEIFISLLSKH